MEAAGRVAAGRLELMVRRPAVDEREVLEEARLEPGVGLVGDRWDGPNPECEVTLMSTGALAELEPDRARWPLAGDQLYVSLDLAEAGIPAGTRLAIGEAVVELSARPHTGCSKFAARFGDEARRVVNSPEGLALRLRGANARVVVAGTVRVGDEVRRA